MEFRNEEAVGLQESWLLSEQERRVDAKDESRLPRLFVVWWVSMKARGNCC